MTDNVPEVSEMVLPVFLFRYLTTMFLSAIIIADADTRRCVVDSEWFSFLITRESNRNIC